MKTPKQLKEYRHEYYIQHKDDLYRKHRVWCNENPVRVKKIQKRWRDKHPLYYCEHMLEREAVSDALIFQFIDNGFGGGTLEDFITFLQAEGVLEQHIGWFKVDVQKHLEKEKGLEPQITQISTDKNKEGVRC